MDKTSPYLSSDTDIWIFLDISDHLDAWILKQLIEMYNAGQGNTIMVKVND